MNIVHFFIALHCYVQNLHLLHFREKFACPCIPKLMFHIKLWVHRFIIIYQFPKSNCMIRRTQHPLLYVFFCFTFQETTMPYALWFTRLQCPLFYIFKEYNVFSHLHFQILQCLQSFTLSKTTMSSIIYVFQRLQCLQSFIFQRLQCLQSFTFQRLQCLQSFTFSKTTLSSVFYIFKNYNVFSILHFQRLQ